MKTMSYGRCIFSNAGAGETQAQGKRRRRRSQAQAIRARTRCRQQETLLGEGRTVFSRFWLAVFSAFACKFSFLPLFLSEETSYYRR